MIPPVMNRPMFNQAQPQLQAPQMSMNPQAQQIQMAEKQASAQALAGMAQGMEDLNQELDNAENYTGVYYVQFSNKCAKTQLIDPFSQNKKIEIEAKEGDIVIFPSYVIHRATEQKENLEKIIISFNINFTKILPNLFKKINLMISKKL